MMQLQVILLTLHSAISLYIKPENIRREIGQISFNNALTMTSAQTFGYTFVNVPKVFIAISHLDISSNVPYSFNVEAQAITLTGFNFVMTASVSTAQFSFYFQYLASTDIHLENHIYCSSPGDNQLFAFNHKYSSPPQISLFLTGIQLSIVSNTISDYSITPTAVSEMNFQVMLRSSSSNTVQKICFQTIVASQNIIQPYYELYDFTSNPLTGSKPVVTLVQNPFYFNNVYTILYGLTGARYNKSPGLRSNTYGVSLIGNQVTYVVETYLSGTLYQYSLDLMLYKPSTCAVNMINNKCLPVCGDGIVDEPEQCDDGNNQAFDGCFNCIQDCPYNCLICTDFQCNQCQDGYYPNDAGLCISKCGDGIIAGFEQCDSTSLSCHECEFQCQLQCTECLYGACKDCSYGYYLNAFNQCESFCGDQIVAGSEQCDDGNINPQDGCWNCVYDCPMNCQSCAQGQCIWCQSGYYNNYNKCDSLCGDGIVTGNEQCDDGNYNSLDGCDQCQRSCYQYCINCQDGICLQCQNGYYLEDNLCTAQCGDRIIAGFEQCDDGNSDIYDGCNNCIIGCPYATFLQINTCKNICGDGLVANDFEQCDDGNRINNDGCSNCIIDKNYVCSPNNVLNRSVCYLCPINCSNCSQGICSYCNNGYFLNQGLCIQCDKSCVTCKDYPTNCIQFVLPNTTTCNVKNGLYPNQITGQCYSICGDSVKAESEQCDDGNILSGDGCNSQCQIESGWYCDRSNPNDCEIKDAVNLILESIQPRNGSYEIKVSLSQNCAINLAQFIGINLNFSIANIHYKNISLFSVDDQNYQNISYLITIIPLQNIDILHLNISTQNLGFISKQGFILAQKSLQLDLFDLQYVSSEQTDALNKLMLFNNYIIYVMIAVGVSSLLVGSFEPVLNMLDLMQYISYLQWIDIYFPFLLEEYLNIFNVVSLDLILEQLKITNPDTYPYYPTGYKLNYYDVNAYLIANLQSFFVTLIQTYAIYTIIIVTFARIINKPMSSNYCKLKLQFIVSSLYNSSLKMHFSGFVQMIMTSYYDLAICLCLYIFYPNIKGDIDSIYIILSLLTIFTLLHTLYESTIINKRKMLPSLRTGIFRKTIYQMQYSQWSLVKKLVFCIIIVGFQESGIIQAILISMNSIYFASFLIINKPLKEPSENFKILSVEIMVALQSLSFIGYELIQNTNIILYLQWLNISIFTLNLCVCLIIDLNNTARRTFKQIKIIIKNTQCLDNTNLNKDFIV